MSGQVYDAMRGLEHSDARRKLEHYAQNVTLDARELPGGCCLLARAPLDEPAWHC
jgi:hypothetical protein